jgi:hypothetical protein
MGITCQNRPSSTEIKHGEPISLAQARAKMATTDRRLERAKATKSYSESGIGTNREDS